MVFERYSRVEKAIESTILESYIQGVPTRNIQNVLKAKVLENISPSYVSSMSAGLDEKVHAFMERPIKHDIRYMYVDATYFRVRDLSACRSKALYIVIGITADGYRGFMGCRLYWRRLKTTNVLERMNLEIKRRKGKIGAFPSEQSQLRVVCSILMDLDEEWMTGRKYLKEEID